MSLARWGLVGCLALFICGCEDEVKPLLSLEQQNELTLLSAKKQEYDKSARLLDNIPVIETDFEVVKGLPHLRFAVENNTNQAIHGIQFRVELKLPGKTKPILMEYIALPIEEGLLPSGVKQWQLQPSNSQQWTQLPELSKASMDIFVESIEGADGRPVYPVMFWSKEDRLRYLELLQMSGG